MADLSLSALTAELARLSRDLDECQRDLAKAEDTAARTRHVADLALSKAFVVAQGSVEQRKHEAFIVTEGHALAAEVAEAGVKAARSRLGVLKTRIDVGRSLLSSAKSEQQVAHYGQAS
jgi:hypothetical protein